MSEQQMLQQAKSYLVEGEMKAAAIELQNTLQENPRNAEAQFLLGLVYKKMGDFSAAQEALRIAAESGWPQQQVQLEIAQVQLKQGKFQKLLDQIKVGDSWTPGYRANLLALRAMAQSGLGETESATSTLAKAVAIDRAALQVFRATAVLQLAGQLPEDASQTLETALEIHSNNAELLLLQARAHLAQKHNSLAAEVFQRIIDLDSSNPISATARMAHIALARLHIADKEFKQAQSVLSLLLEDNDFDVQAHYLSGLIAFQQRHYDVAEAHISKILKVVPEHLPSKRIMGRIKFALKHYDSAVQYLSSYLKEAPEDLAARKLLVQSYLAQNQPLAARTALEVILAEHPQDPDSLLLMSELEFSEGNQEASIGALREAVELAPGDPLLRRQLGIAYLRGGQLQQAIEQIEVYRQQTEHKQEADRLLIAAYLQADRHDKAIEIVRAMQNADPKNPVVVSLSASVYASSGKHQQARVMFEEALQLESGMLSASLGLAQLEREQGHIEAAKDIYRDLVRQDKGGTVPMLALAELSAQQGLEAEMLSWLEKARELDAEESRVRIMLANAYLNRQQLDSAEKLVREAIDISPDNAETMALEARYLMLQGLYAESLLPLNRLVNNMPASAYARILLGEAYTHLNMLNDAYEHFSKAIEIKPESATALHLRAENELKKGHKEVALAYARLLQRIQADSHIGYKLEGDAWLVSEEFDKANAAYSRAWEKRKTAAIAIGLFNALKQAGDLDAALEPILIWLNRNPGDTAMRFFLATIYQNTKHNDDAIREYKKVLKQTPGSAAALNNLAWLYYLAGDSRAIDMAKEAYKYSPDEPGIQDTYGWILLQHGQLDDGRRLLEQALEQLPDNPEVRYHVATALLKSGKKDEGVRILEKLLNEETPFTGREQAEILLAEYRSDN